MDEAGLEDLVNRINDLDLVVGSEQTSVISTCLVAILDRLLLGRLATDERFALIRRFPEIYGGESRGIIETRLEELGIVPQERNYLAPKLRTILIRGKGAGANKAVVTDGVFRAVTMRIARSGVTNVRCACCGYHFRRGDLNLAKQKIVEACGLEFSDRMRVEREGDNVKTPYYTELEVDHIVPRSGWGPSDPPNLQLMCKLCNQGKMNFETGFETLSVLAASSYSLMFSMAGSRLNFTIFYASIMMNGRRCAECGRSADDLELTIVPRDEWFTPWTVQVSCYECFSSE